MTTIPPALAREIEEAQDLTEVEIAGSLHERSLSYRRSKIPSNALPTSASGPQRFGARPPLEGFVHH